MYQFPRNKTPLYKPTYNQVREYFEERGIKKELHPQMFYAHYESNGWLIGKNPMVSYKGAIASWIMNKPELREDPSSSRIFDTSGYSQAEKDAQQAQIIKAYEKQRNNGE